MRTMQGKVEYGFPARVGALRHPGWWFTVSRGFAYDPQRMNIFRTLVVSASLAGLTSSFAAAQSTAPAKGDVGLDVPSFQVRPGYRVDLAAGDLGESRFMQFSADGKSLYLSQPKNASIQTLQDPEGDGTFELVNTFIDGKPSVHCMDFADGWLYFTQASDGSCHRARDTDGDGAADDIEVVLPPGTVAAGGGHPFRGILVSADSIYITVSDTTNTTEKDDGRKAIYQFDKDGKNKRTFVTGIRNTEKIRFRPGTKEIWGMDHGSDWYGKPLGDDKGKQPITNMLPPEELNHYVEGGFYGHPFLLGDRIPRIEFMKRDDIIELAAKTIVPEYNFGAHWAGNGFTFLTKEHFPDHAGDMFIAFHGSWNSEQRVGYRVERCLFDKVTGKPYGALQIVSTLSEDGSKVLGRPVDCVEAPDGSVLFSCDLTNAIYRIRKADR